MSIRPNGSSKLGAGRGSFWLSAALLLLLGCGNSGDGSSLPCQPALCPAEGYECNPNTNQCELLCVQSQCPDRAECSSRFGRCVGVSCGQVTPCLDSGNICDEYAYECYPTSGRCDQTADCPLYDGRVAKAASLSCKSGFCHLASQLPDIPTTQRPTRIEVAAPGTGAQINTAGELKFQWSGGSEYTTILLVLTDLPKDLSQALTVAVWGHVLPAEAPQSALWQDGKAIVNGVWLDSTAAVPPGPLYALVQGVLDGKLVALSAPVPFRVGSAWPAPYDPCSDNIQLPGSCASPVQPQICWSHYCRILCAAHKDCPQGTLCAAPVMGVRICG